MSHYVCLVLTDEKPENEEQAKEMIKEPLAPFDENKEVEPHEEECGCVGNIALSAGHDTAKKEHGSIDDIRKKFDEEIEPLIMAPYIEKYGTMETWDNKISDTYRIESDTAYNLLFAPYNATKKEVAKAHPLFNKPDPNCGLKEDGTIDEDDEGCRGTGKVMSTYNPQSKWDWYGVGGRWNGYLSDYDPKNDPRNFEICRICNGAGKRTDMEVANGCNGCEGKGTHLKWSGHVFQSSNIMAVKDLPLDDPEKWAKICPFAVLDTEGKWHEKGEMGWWGMAQNLKDKGEWIASVREHLLKHQDQYAIVVDIHI